MRAIVSALFVTYLLTCAVLPSLYAANPQRWDNEHCPSYCDEQGTWQPHKPCMSGIKAEVCCQVSDLKLQCCTNTSLKVSDSIGDDYNCYNPALTWLTKYWRLVLGICVPLGIISVVAAVAICAVQNLRQKRSREPRHRPRDSRASSVTSFESGTVPGSGTPPSVRNQNFADSDRDGDLGFEEGQDIFYLEPCPPLSHGPPPYTADKPPDYMDIYP